MNKTHHGPVITVFSVERLQHFFIYVRRVLVATLFSLLLIDRYIIGIIVAHEEHLWYWSEAIFWTASDALTPWL